MGYQQIVFPDPNAQENPGMCLGLVAKSYFGGPSGVNCATDAWNMSGTKNGSRSLPDVAVPVFFSWWGNINGTYKDWGHTCVYFPGRGFLSSPGRWTDGWGQQWFGSLEEIERWFGCQYVGFTLDLPFYGVLNTVASVTDEPTPAPIPEPAPTPSGQVVIVEPWPAQTSTLWGIAEQVWGDGSRFGELASYNGIANPNLIFPGQEIRIP